MTSQQFETRSWLCATRLQASVRVTDAMDSGKTTLGRVRNSPVMKNGYVHARVFWMIEQKE